MTEQQSKAIEWWNNLTSDKRIFLLRLYFPLTRYFSYNLEDCHDKVEEIYFKENQLTII